MLCQEAIQILLTRFLFLVSPNDERRTTSDKPLMENKNHPWFLCHEWLNLISGNVLLSRPVARQVPSTLRGLTAVFGMGTGGSLSPSSPENLINLIQVLLHLQNCIGSIVFIPRICLRLPVLYHLPPVSTKTFRFWSPERRTTNHERRF
jgi:hypothetical protein